MKKYEHISSFDKRKENLSNNRILSSTIEKTNSFNETPKLLKKLNQILSKKENKRKIDIHQKIRLIKNENLWDEFMNNNKRININNLSMLTFNGNMTYNNKDKKKKKIIERNILSSLYTRKRKKDFLSVTSNINYLLKRNQKLLIMTIFYMENIIIIII